MLRLARNVERTVTQFDQRIERLAVQRLHQRPVPQLQHRLDHTRRPGRQLQMPDIALHRAQRTAVGRKLSPALLLRQLPECTLESLHLDRVAQRRSRPVRLDVADTLRPHLRMAQRRLDQLRLRPRVWRRQRVRPAAMVLRTAADQRIDMVAVALRCRQPLEHQHAHTFAAHIAIPMRRECLAAALRTEHPRLGEADMRTRRRQHIDSAGHRQRALPALQQLHRTMDRNQRARARRLDRFARTMQVQKIAHPVRADRGHRARRAMTLDARPRSRQQAGIATIGRSRPATPWRCRPGCEVHSPHPPAPPTPTSSAGAAADPFPPPPAARY